MFTSYPMDHPNLTVVHFNAYAGGKFWINCLAHHPDAMPLLGKITDHHWSMCNLEDTFKQKLKLAHINSSLPSHDNLHRWCQYEHGHLEMWGVISSDAVPENSLRLLDQYHCFTVNHNVSVSRFQHIWDTFPLVKHIVLVNATKFQTLAAKLKSEDFDIITTDLPLDYNDVFYVNVDRIWFNLPLLGQTVRQCWDWLGLCEHTRTDVYDYATRYFELHQ